MAAIAGQPAPKPGTLKGPVANKNTADALLADLDSFSAPEVSVPEVATPAAQGTAESLMTDVAPPEQGQDFPVEEPPSFLSPKIGQQMEDLPTRIAANIANDPASVKLTLEKKFGKENVREREGKFFYKKPGKDKFTELDPGTFEIVNDLFSDMYREYIMTMGGVAGGAAGVGAGIPTGPGALATGVAGTALGVAGASQAVDVLGQTQYGVVKAPRDGGQLREEGVLPDIQRAAETTGGKIIEGGEFALLDRIGGALLNKASKFLNRGKDLKNLAEIPPIERLQDGVRNNLETLADMRNIGMTSTIPGTNVEIPAHQLLPHFPEATKTAMSVSGEKSFQNAQKIAAENIHNSVLDLVETASGLSGKSLKEAVSKGIPKTSEVSTADVAGLFRRVRNEEGAIIGEFRKFAKGAAEKSPLPSPRTSQAVSNIFERLGVSMDGKGKLVFPDDDSLVQLMGNKDIVPGFKKDLQMIQDRLVKGGLNIDELIGQSAIIGAKNDGARRIGGAYKQMIGELSSAIRADSRNGVAMVLPEAEAKIYAQRMNKYASISESMEQLGNYLNDDLGANTFAKGLVNKGKDGLANLRAAKEVLLAENPEMYRNVIGNYFEELALKHRDPSVPGMFNAKAMRKELAGLGGEYLDELFPAKGPINKSLVLRSFDLADQVGNAIVKGTDEDLRKGAQQLTGVLSNYIGHKVNAVWAMYHFGAKDARLLKMLSKEGVESFLEQTPKANREVMRKALTSVLQIARANGTLMAVENMPRPQLDLMSGVPGFSEQINEARKGTPVR